ncbi:MAG: pyridoxamine 5'-phosphate oxidase family protein [Acidimicrobiales bacterium]
MTNACTRVLLPLPADDGPDADNQATLLRTGTLFSRWLNAPLQLVCSNAEDLPGYQTLAWSLGVPIVPVLWLEDQLHGRLLAHAESFAPSLIIAEPSPEGLALASASSQPVLLIAEARSNLTPVGPFVVELTGDDSDLDALALAAVYSRSMDENVQLLVTKPTTTTPVSASYVENAERRLREMGCQVGVDSLVTGDLAPLVVSGKTRRATAIVIPQGRLSDVALIKTAIDEGVSLLVAPAPQKGATRSTPFETDLTAPAVRPQADQTQADQTPAGAHLAILDHDECLSRLSRHSLARIGYVDAGWPVVVPVNYQLDDGDIYIRSLAGGKLEAAKRGDVVCLELDGYDERLRTGWSVLAHGSLELIEDPAVLRRAWANDPEPWVSADHWQWLRMVPLSLTGRDVAPSAFAEPSE